jgi:hypothetical protein
MRNETKQQSESGRFNSRNQALTRRQQRQAASKAALDARRTRDAEQAAAKAALVARQARLDELGVKMGRVGGCFGNAMACVIQRPDRLVYVEGFYIHGCKCCNDMTFIHHGWIKDTVTSEQHEVTIRDVDADAVYVGKEFTRDELYSPYEDARIESADMWTQQLTVQQEHDMLVAAGYDVKLTRELFTNYKTKKFDVTDWADVPLDSIDMTLNSADASYVFEAKYPSGHDDGCNGWRLIWRLREAATHETDAMAATA